MVKQKWNHKVRYAKFIQTPLGKEMERDRLLKEKRSCPKYQEGYKGLSNALYARWTNFLAEIKTEPAFIEKRDKLRAKDEEMDGLEA